MSLDATRAIFVGNFEYDARSSDLHRLFSEHGPVSRIDLKRGFAFVFMRDLASGTAAIRALDGQSYGSRTLKVEWARGDGAIKRREDERRKRCTQPSDTLFVVNFDPSTTTDRLLHTAFQPFGRIVRLDMQQRFAFVQFESISSASDALRQLNGSQLADRTLTVEYTVRSAGTHSRKRVRDNERRFPSSTQPPLQRNTRPFRRYGPATLRHERPRSPYTNSRPSYPQSSHQSHYRDLDRAPDNPERTDSPNYRHPDSYPHPPVRQRKRSRSRSPNQRRSRTSRSPNHPDSDRQPNRTPSPSTARSPRRTRSPRRRHHSTSRSRSRSPTHSTSRSRSPPRSPARISRRYSRSPINEQPTSRSRSRERHNDWSRDGRDHRAPSISPHRKRMRSSDNDRRRSPYQSSSEPRSGPNADEKSTQFQPNLNHQLETSPKKAANEAMTV